MVAIYDHAPLVQRLQEEEWVATLGPLNDCHVHGTSDSLLESMSKSQSIQRIVFDAVDEKVDI